MKKVLFIVAIAIFGLGKLNAQENVVKVNPLAILGGSDLASYERAIGDKSSLIISGAVGAFNFSGVKYSSYSVGGQYRYYFKDVLKGWYGAGIVAFESGTVEDNGILNIIVNNVIGVKTDNKYDFTAYRVGAKGGYQWIWDSGFSLDLNVGFAYSNFNYDNADSDLKNSGILPSFGFGLGYAW